MFLQIRRHPAHKTKWILTTSLSPVQSVSAWTKPNIAHDSVFVSRCDDTQEIHLHVFYVAGSVHARDVRIQQPMFDERDGGATDDKLRRLPSHRLDRIFTLRLFAGFHSRPDAP